MYIILCNAIIIKRCIKKLTINALLSSDVSSSFIRTSLSLTTPFSNNPSIFSMHLSILSIRSSILLIRYS